MGAIRDMVYNYDCSISGYDKVCLNLGASLEIWEQNFF